MASPLSSLPAAPPPVARSNSITSTNSASSSVSLRRRSRTRRRTLTRDARRGVSAGPSTEAPRGRALADDSQTAVLSQPDIPPLPTRFPHLSPQQSPAALPDVQVLSIPPRRERAWSTVHIRDVPPEAGRGRGSKSDGGSTSKAKLRARGMSLPRSAFRPATASSDESSIASPRTPTGPLESPFVGVRAGNSQHFRDSVISSSTSLYPQSTSTDSYADSSLAARSPKKADHDFAEGVVVHNGQADFDVDDVSYRLRLLVNNSYFLPPAHSKPSPLSLVPPKPPADQKPAKASAPAFLDFFRMSKSKSKPSSPLAQTPPVTEGTTSGPILRTTSDSSTAGGYLARPQTQPLSQAPTNQSFSAFQQPPPSRVVVLRERMDDLMEAAKQVEKDMKLRGDVRKAKSQGTPKAKDSFDDVIDPTDTVDLPPPSAEYPFAVQTSALHGLGPGESLGADLLADRLPPSPGQWSMSTEEESWRKAILQEAVSLSLTESPESSFASMSPPPPAQESELPSFRAEDESKSPEPASPPTPKAALFIGQRIVEPSALEKERDEARTLSPLSALYTLQPGSPSALARASSMPEGSRTSWNNVSLLPRRAETPAATLPLTPPPPRKHFSHPQLSMSISEISRPSTADPEPGRDSLNVLRKVVSSPRLSAMNPDHREAMSPTPPVDSITQRLGMLSPPVPDHTVTTRSSFVSLRGPTPFSDDDDLSYGTPMDGDVDDDQPRPSMTLSIPTIGRTSMSESPNASPTASAFEDAVFGSCRSPSPMLFRRSYAGSLGGRSAAPSPVLPARPNVVSPPPRKSTSASETIKTILPPPPRSPAVKPVYRPSTSSGRSSHSAEPLHTAMEASTSEHDVELSPSTVTDPSLPLSARRGRQSGLSLHIPPEIIAPAIHSAPAPASPTAFFDEIQAQHNAMDDLETSDESDAEGITPPPPPPPPQSHSDSASTRTSTASSRPSFTRLGNHSTPHLAPGALPADAPRPLSFDTPDRRLPIAHIADRDAVSVRSWKKGARALPRRESEGGASASRIPRPVEHRPATAGAGERRVQRESLQKFEGLLLDHIASERDTIRRITSNISGARQG